MRHRSSVSALPLLALGLLLLGAGPVASQAINTTVSGEVTDRAGVPLAGATIVLENEATGFRSGSITNRSGQFTFRQLPIGGAYVASASSLGYQEQQRTGIVLRLGSSIEVSFQLAESAIELEELVVTAFDFDARAERLGSTSSLVADQIEQLPTAGRNVLNLASLTPLSGRGLDLSGQRGMSTNLTIDGMNARDQFKGGAISSGPYTTSIRSPEDLTRLRDSGIPLGNVIAHTGSREPEDPTLYDLLRAEGMYTMVGTLGAMDREAALGDREIYRDLLRNGATIISTDRPVKAAEAIAPLLEAAPVPAGPAPTAPHRAEHVVLISVDGFRPDFYLDDGWPAPTIQQMAREGAYARAVRGVFPSVTFPSHTTLITGALPARHGIYNNTPFEPRGQTGRWYWEFSSIRVPTLWDAVRGSGRTTASVSWPVSVGAPIDGNVPEVWTQEEGIAATGAMRAAATPPGLVEERERDAVGPLNERTFSGDDLSREDRVGTMAAYLLEHRRPALLTVHLIATDHFQHEEGRDGPKTRRALAAVDRAIGKMWEAAERAGISERTAFVITGDHGFVDVHTQVHPNVWLSDARLLEDQPDRGDWRAAFHTSGGSALLYLNHSRETSRAAERICELLDHLPCGEQRPFRVVNRAELDRTGSGRIPRSRWRSRPPLE